MNIKARLWLFLVEYLGFCPCLLWIDPYYGIARFDVGQAGLSISVAFPFSLP